MEGRGFRIVGENFKGLEIIVEALEDWREREYLRRLERMREDLRGLKRIGENLRGLEREKGFETV